MQAVGSEILHQRTGAEGTAPVLRARDSPQHSSTLCQTGKLCIAYRPGPCEDSRRVKAQPSSLADAARKHRKARTTLKQKKVSAQRNTVKEQTVFDKREGRHQSQRALRNKAQEQDSGTATRSSHQKPPSGTGQPGQREIDTKNAKARSFCSSIPLESGQTMRTTPSKRDNSHPRLTTTIQQQHPPPSARHLPPSRPSISPSRPTPNSLP